METHVAEIVSRVKATDEAYREEHAKLQNKYMGKVKQFDMEIQLYMSGIIQQLCSRVGIKYVPGSGHDIKLVTDTIPLGVAYLVHTPPEGETVEIVSPGKDRLN